MAKSVKLQVITPSKLFYSGDIELVIARTLTGDEGFMADHAWACKLLGVGEIWIQESGTKDFKVAAIYGGFVDVKDDIIIYTDSAEWSSDIDTTRAAGEREKAEKWLVENERTAEDVDITRAKQSVVRQKLRMNVAGGGARRKR